MNKKHSSEHYLRTLGGGAWNFLLMAWTFLNHNSCLPETQQYITVGIHLLLSRSAIAEPFKINSGGIH